MKLNCERFSIFAEPLSGGDEEGWLRLRTRITVPGFEGKFIPELQVEDMERFKDDLLNMIEKIGTPCKAVLSSAEPGLHLSLKSDALGNIKGAYGFESDSHEGVPTRLAGAFSADQSYLMPLIHSIDSNLEWLKTKKQPSCIN